jgi:hypothetical protein
MIVLPIEENEKSRILIFSADLEVDASENKIKFNKKSVSNLLEKGSENNFELKNHGAKYFVRLLIQINKWKNKIS